MKSDCGCASPQVSTAEPLSPDLLAALKALADPVRLAIFRMLRQREHCVCHLTDATGLSQGTVSYHTGILKKAGLVRDRRDPDDGRWTYYSLNSAGIEETRRALNTLLEPQAVDPTPTVCCDG